jgi:hypothetical protein
MGPVPIHYYPSITVLKDSRDVSKDLSGRLGYFMGFCKSPDKTISDLRFDEANLNHTILLYVEPDYVFGNNKLIWAKSLDVLEADSELLIDKYDFDKSRFLEDFDRLDRFLQENHGISRVNLERSMWLKYA